MENWLLVMKSVIGLLALKISNYFLADVMCGGGFRIENKLPKNAFRTCVERPKKKCEKKNLVVRKNGIPAAFCFWLV